MRTFKRVLKVLGLVVAVVLVNELLIFALEPYGSRIGGKWQDAYEMPEMDTLVIGTSLIEDAVDPAVLDENLGSVSINLGTAMQMADESYLGMRTVLDNRDISLVILSVDLPYYQTDRISNPGSPFLREKNSHEPFTTAVSDAAFLFANSDLAKKSDSLNWMFPYVYNHVPGTPKSIMENIRNKIARDRRVQDLAAYRSEMEPWQGQGYCNSDDVYGFSNGRSRTYRELHGVHDLDQGKLDLVEKMCDLCEDKGVDLVVVHPPLPRFQVLDYGDEWYAQTEQMRQLVEAHGGTFFDFNLVRTDLFPYEDDYFQDMQHMNNAGAASFSKALATVLKAWQDGEDCGKFFYEPEEYEKSFDKVAHVRLKSSTTGSGIKVTARAIVGEGCAAEYQFLMRASDDEEWTVARDYSKKATFTYKPSQRGTYQLRVNSRLVGSEASYEKYSKLEERY